MTSGTAAGDRREPADPRSNLLFESPQIAQLWQAGRYGEIVDQVEKHLDRLPANLFAGMGAPALEGWVADLYLMQQHAIGTCNRIAYSEEPTTALRALKLIQRIGDLQTAAFRRAVVLDNVRDPNAVEALRLYRNTMKQPGFHQPNELEAYFIKKARKFIRKGGDLSQIKPVGAEQLAEIKSGQLYEWAVDCFDIARMADGEKEPTPGHTLLTWGQDALGAGSMRLFRDESGAIEQVIVATFSGHFRNGSEAVPHMVRHLVAAGVPPERIIIHEGEAASPRSLEVVYRALGRDGDDSQRLQDELLAKAMRWNPYAAGPMRPAEAAPREIREVGVRPAADAGKLNELLFAMRLAADRALTDGVVLAAEGEGAQLVSSIDQVLTASEQAGNPLAYGQARALLDHLTALAPARIDAAASAELTALGDRWNGHVFGQGAFDAADVMGPRPLGDRRARIVARVTPEIGRTELTQLIEGGANSLRFAVTAAPDQLATAIARARQVAAELGRPVAIQLELQGQPAREVDQSPLTGADREALVQLLDLVDLVVQKSVQGPGDLLWLQSAMARQGKLLPVIATIDSQQGLDQLERIASLADGLTLEPDALVARLGFEALPDAEDRLHAVGNALGKPTELLPSLGAGHDAVRALYHAVRAQGTDAICLAATTTPETLRRIARVVETAESEKSDALYRARDLRAVELRSSSVLETALLLRGGGRNSNPAGGNRTPG